MSVLLIDHDMGLVLEVCDYIYVLDFGQVIAEGTRRHSCERGGHRRLPWFGGSRMSTTETETPSAPDGNGITAPALDVRNLVAGWGGVPAVRGLSLHVHPGEVVALLGPNGAGKTTTLLTIAGVLKPIDGEIDVLGSPLGHASAHQIARRGVALLPEDRGIFFQLSVAENLRLHRHRHSEVTESDVTGWFPALEELLDRRTGLLSEASSRCWRWDASSSPTPSC